VKCGGVIAEHDVVEGHLIPIVVRGIVLRQRCFVSERRLNRLLEICCADLLGKTDEERKRCHGHLLREAGEQREDGTSVQEDDVVGGRPDLCDSALDVASIRATSSATRATPPASAAAKATDMSVSR